MNGYTMLRHLQNRSVNWAMIMHKFVLRGSLMAILVFGFIYDGHTQKIPRKATAHFQDAVYDIGLNQFATAKEKLALAIRSHPEYTDAHLYLADIHFLEKDWATALKGYDLVKTLGDHPARVDLFRARSLFALSDFEAATVAAAEFLEQPGISASARRDAELLVVNAGFSMKALQAPVEFSPVNLGVMVNSASDEYLPALSADEGTVIFTRKIMGQEDLFVTGITDGSWKMSEPLDGGTINTGHNEGAHCISADGKLLLYTICNERFTLGSCDIYRSEHDLQGWTPPANLGAPVNSVSWDGQPSISADGSTVYFVSSRKGGYGGKDIWSCTWENDYWSDPVNLGSDINTAGDEQTPFIHFDDQTLYFCSDGHPGMGSHDLFVARRTNGQWGTPVNLGHPINTQGAESGLTVSLNGQRGYFAAQREDGYGGLDIYEFGLPPFARPFRVAYVKARIRDHVTGSPIAALVHAYDLQGKRIDTRRIARNGDIMFCLPAGTSYSFQVEKEGYLLQSVHFRLDDTVTRDAYLYEIALLSVAEGQTAILRNVFFETDSDALRPESDKELEVLHGFLVKHPALIVEIGGHTDNTGSLTYNLDLSMRRAKRVVDHLVSKGIDQSRLIANGYGPERPVADNDTPEGRAENRRTEFRIMDTGK